MKAAGGIFMACLLFFIVPRRRFQGHYGSLPSRCSRSGSLTALSGCGGSGGSKYPGTPVWNLNRHRYGNIRLSHSEPDDLPDHYSASN